MSCGQLQRTLTTLTAQSGDDARVVHNFATSSGLVDLAVLVGGTARVIIECKYEPARHRSDFVTDRLQQPVVFWDKDGVLQDIRRVASAVAAGDAAVGYAVFFDEGGRCSGAGSLHRQAHGSTGNYKAVTWPSW